MKKREGPLYFGLSQMMTLLLCAAAVVYLVLVASHQVAVGVALGVSLLSLGLAYLIGTRISGICVFLTWVGLLIYELLSPDPDMLTIIVTAVWMIAQIIALSGQHNSLKSRILREDFSKAYDKRLMLLDEGTELRSMRAYLNDTELYMRIARRHSLGLALMTWRVVSPQVFRQKLGYEGYAALRKAISDVLRASVRTEDMVYMIDEEACMWGSLMLTDVDKLDRIYQRILPKLKTCFGRNASLAEIEVRWTVFDPEAELSPLKLLEEAKGAPAAVIKE